MNKANISQILDSSIAPYDKTLVSTELPEESILVADAYSDKNEDELAEKANQHFSANNASPQSAKRLKNHIDDRNEGINNPQRKTLTKRMHGTDHFYTRLINMDQQKRTVYNKVIFLIAAVAALATPLIAWYAMANYLTSSGFFPDFYDVWWKPFLFSFLGVSSLFLFKQYEERVLKNDEARRRFIQKWIWLSVCFVTIWIVLFSSLFSFAEEGLLEGSDYESLIAFGFTIFHLVGEISTGFCLWTYSSYLNNKNKVVETEPNREFLSAEELEAIYTADAFTLHIYSAALNDFIECYEQSKDVFISNFLNVIDMHRGRMEIAKHSAVFNYIDGEVGVSSSPISGPKLVHGG